MNQDFIEKKMDEISKISQEILEEADFKAEDMELAVPKDCGDGFMDLMQTTTALYMQAMVWLERGNMKKYRENLRKYSIFLSYQRQTGDRYNRMERLLRKDGKYNGYY